jgi:DNA end-binding protein Ku
LLHSLCSVHKPKGPQMSQYRAWRGAIELAGFNVNIGLYSRVQKQRTESFRQIGPSGRPIVTKLFDPVTDKEVERDALRKGVDIGNDEYVVLSPEAVEQISSGVKTAVAKLEAFAPVDTIALDLSIDRFAVLPDDKVPGAEQPVNIVWNGLRETGLAYLTVISPRGGHDAILVLYADAGGLWASLLPFEEELYDYPVHEYVEDAGEAKAFQTFVDSFYADKVQPYFDHAALQSEYRPRRQAAIEAAIEGREITPAPEVEPVTGPDLMAMMSAKLKEAQESLPPAARKKRVRKAKEPTVAKVVKP